MGWQRVGHDWATFTFFTLQRQRASWVSRVGHVLVTEQQQQHIFSSVQLLSRVSLRPQESQHARPPCPWPTPGVYSNSCPSSRWCHPAISSSVSSFSSCPQFLPASGSFLMSQLFAWGGQSIGVWASHIYTYMNNMCICIYMWRTIFSINFRENNNFSP